MKRLILAVFLAASALSYAQTGATTVIRHSGTLPTTCSGGDIYIKSGTSAGFYFNIASGSCSWLSNAGPTDAAGVVALFDSGSCSGYLKSDGTCDTPSGSGSVPDTGTTPNIAIVSDGSHGIAVATGTVGTGGSGTSRLQFTSTTIAGLSGLTSLVTGQIIEITDGATCGDTSTGSGSIAEFAQYNGSGWTVVACGPWTPSVGAIVLITETVLGSAGPTFTFTSIPSTYRDLIVKCSGRGTAATSYVTAGITFNGDTSASYDWQEVQGTGTAGTGQAAGAVVAAGTNFNAMSIPGASAAANYPGALNVVVYDYKNTTWYKEIDYRNTVVGPSISGSNWYYQTGGGFWRNTAAITSITVTASTGNFAVGTRCSLYGSY